MQCSEEVWSSTPDINELTMVKLTLADKTFRGHLKFYRIDICGKSFFVRASMGVAAWDTHTNAFWTKYKLYVLCPGCVSRAHHLVETSGFDCDGNCTWKVRSDSCPERVFFFFLWRWSHCCVLLATVFHLSASLQIFHVGTSVGIICRCFWCLYMIPQFEITKKGNMQWHIVQALRDCITAEWTHCIVV